ncbi:MULTISPECIES: DUF441 domain-containing protein [Clostridium]|uniref:UPF0756 membrane protein NT01CX_1209 n=1 Tax=Clostridium novyi (strain NT) TaxID=386415 RepID=Y1209_CLONN|nr:MULTISPECIES: DUF441 domain-containing protein [Clostridium]A0PY40.1 RecName: Full=UPF0756 membrane protein NT01CX_1209 [Clostridium novyi NT]ABK61790.1 conserved hypothetical protein [Clostridium novyi NT]KEH84795.1 hypothetical protein Z966_10250 [Clostridium novyi A str. NCTC 538]KEH84928.1 hypothetical protein Z965_11265 [Clostridium novyi A str. BKT29909]KEH91380.1 hypothetical protein Z963_09920 [Clostridium botulinum C/D str. It1]
MSSKIILLILMFLSFISKNKSLGIATIVMLFISFFNTEKCITFMENHFMNLGMTFLMIWMLIPIIKNPEFTENIKNAFNLKGIVCFLCGAIVAVLASKGVGFLKGSTDTLTGIILGSIVGVSLLGGVPVGPLIASGIAYEVVFIINLIFKNNC